jgi:hypothetical protein
MKVGSILIYNSKHYIHKMGIVSLMTSASFNSLGNDVNVVGNFETDVESGTIEKYVSTPLVNYVEPYVYKGVEKTLFYTEVNSNLKEGERVFIVNGNYDSAERIKIDKYKKGSDGYRVLYVDRCQIVLDIDYTGTLPVQGGTSEDYMSDYVKIQYIDSYDTFLTANKQLTTRGGYMGGRFDYYQNWIAYIDYDYPSIDDGWVSTTGVTASPGFYVREPAYDPNMLSGTKGEGWVSITKEFISGSYSLASPTANPKVGLRHLSNNKLLVVGKSFTYKGTEFKSGNVYKFEASKGWIANIEEQGKYSSAIITKGNFRNGDFSGKFNSGLYGSREKKITWRGTGIWNGGTLFNTLWLSGSMFSKIEISESHQTLINNNRKPYQKVNTWNNGGYGWNYVLDSEFDNTSIYSAIVRNTKFGMTPSSQVVERYLTSATQSFDKILDGGLYESCEFINTQLLGGAIKNSRSWNSVLDGVKHINSFTYDSVLVNSTLFAEPAIKIDGYDEWSTSERRGSNVFGKTFSNDFDFKVYKLYVGEADWKKMRSGDSFYVKGIRIKNDPELMNFFDKKFTIGSWTEFVDEFNSTGNQIGSVDPNVFYKSGISCAAFLTTLEENEWIYSSIEYRVPDANFPGGKVSGYITDVVKENPNPRYSIDIFVSTKDTDFRTIEGLNFNSTTQSVSSLNYIQPKQKSVVDFSNAYIIDSNVESGVIDNCNWISGYDIGYNKDLIISGLTNSQDMTTYNVDYNSSNGEITVTTLKDQKFFEIVDRSSYSYESDVKTGDVLFIAGFDYYSKGKVLGFTISDPGSNYTPPVDSVKLYQPDSVKGYGLMVDYIPNLVSPYEIQSVNVVTYGLDYKVGDRLYLKFDNQGSLNGGTDAHITVTSVSELDTVRLPNYWKVVTTTTNTITLSSLNDTDKIMGLTQSGIFITEGAENRWNGFKKMMIMNSNIKSGIFKRSTLVNNVIEAENYPISDRDFINIDGIKGLLLSETIFANNGNQLGAATYHNSSIFGGSDVWKEGIAYRSILNGVNFNSGIVKDSTWIDGTFNGGLFYQSNSYDGKPSKGYEKYNTNRILSHYKSGSTIGTTSNDRHSWRKGTFNGGVFYKSDWEDGNFNGGEFYGSKWYGGVANGGSFGNESTDTRETVFYAGTINFTTVQNATFVADDTSATGITNSIIWNNGTFNGGVFGANRNYTSTGGGEINGTTISGNAQINKQNSKIYTFNITDTETSISKIEVTLTYRQISSPAVPLDDIEILLTSPNSGEAVLKKSGIGVGYELFSTVFSTDGTNDLTVGMSPYTSTFNFDYIEPITNELNDMIDSTNGISGIWTLNITNTSSTNDITAYVIADIKFTKNPILVASIENSAIWKGGNFNSGQFIDYAIWENGDFNNGKFLSTWGWENSGDYLIAGPATSHTWQNGRFNGGEFGNGATGPNSTWATGVFNAGYFKGRVWSDGIFKYGLFEGSGTNATGRWTLKTGATSSNAMDFVNTYLDKGFYGLWRKGLITNDKYISLYEIMPNKTKASDNEIQYPDSRFKNALWMDGIFDHGESTFQNSVWMSGTFSKGTMLNSSFNPYVMRPSGLVEFSNNTIWKDGTFKEGDIFYTDWEIGNFISGTAAGIWFKDGVSRYMNAYNVVWGSTSSYPVWKNGNWYGSEIDYDGSIVNEMYQNIIRKCRNINLFNTDLHAWNVFKDGEMALSESIFVGLTDEINLNFDIIDELFDKDPQKYYPTISWR